MDKRYLGNRDNWIFLHATHIELYSVFMIVNRSVAQNSMFIEIVVGLMFIVPK